MYYGVLIWGLLVTAYFESLSDTRMHQNERSADRPPKNTRILFRSQLVLLIAFISLAIIFSLVLKCGEKKKVTSRPGQQNEIRR